MLAQLLLMSLLWVGLMAFVVIDGNYDDDALEAMQAYEAVMRVAESLADKPAQQHQSLYAIELALREHEEGVVIPDELGRHMLVWQGGRQVYRTLGKLPPIEASAREGLETRQINGRRWHMRTRRSTLSDTQVALLTPVGPWEAFVVISSRGYYLLPLVISLPFLLLSPWLSIRLALRSWSQVSQQVALRGPRDLAPLTFKPAHLELARMVDSINALLLRVDQSARRERSFIADAAHELRTPLAAMRINVEALQAQSVEPRQRELLSGILSSSDRAARLVGQLLLLMRSDATEGGPRHPVALDSLLQDRLAALSSLAARDGIELELLAGEGVTILGERESLTSLIDNLVDNAIKYSPPRAIVTVALAIEAGGVLLSVRDRGPGIAPALRQRVFDRFFRAPRQTRTGSGLGLSIAQSAVRQHGGAIALEEADGGGLLVCVSLPLRRP